MSLGCNYPGLRVWALSVQTGAHLLVDPASWAFCSSAPLSFDAFCCKSILIFRYKIGAEYLGFLSYMCHHTISLMELVLKRFIKLLLWLWVLPPLSFLSASSHRASCLPAAAAVPRRQPGHHLPARHGSDWKPESSGSRLGRRVCLLKWPTLFFDSKIISDCILKPLYFNPSYRSWGHILSDPGRAPTFFSELFESLCLISPHLPPSSGLCCEELFVPTVVLT